MKPIDIILNLINERGIKTSTFYEDLKIGKDKFSEWKRGKTTSYTEYITEIADYFNVTTDYLFGRTNIIMISSLQPKERKKTIEKYLNLAKIYNMMNEYEELKTNNISDLRLEEIVKSVENRIERQGSGKISIQPSKLQLKFALEDPDMSDEALNDVLAYAKFKKEQREKGIK
ncbi:MAG: hypothetical protein FWD48_01020 [Oscillospiraceae bacterium]|nr:hypothetical protein [Oscillospiraceae bacterium]